MVAKGKKQKSKGKNGFENKVRMLRFLSLCFAYPNSAFLPNLRERLRGITAEREKTACETLLKLFEQENNAQLQGEYTRLFITGYPNTPCPPYESVFREGRMLGTCSRNIQTLYEEWDMTADTGILDHISTELEFLAFLASAATLDLTREEASKTYELFIQHHLSQWLPDFAKELGKHAKIPAYRELASLLATSVPSTLL